MGELPPGEQTAVQQHLDSCPACSAEYENLREAIGLVPRPSALPEDERTEEFWQGFAGGVERRLASRVRRLPFLDRLRDGIVSLFVMRGGQIAAAGLSAAMAVLALVLILHRPADRDGKASDGPKPGQEAAHPAPSSSLESTPPVQGAEAAAGTAAPHRLLYAGNRVTQYFRRSKILLIGITNMQDEPEGSLDLSAERRTSRALVKESRYLKQQSNLDPRARELIDELNRVLIGLANLSDDTPGVEIIRGGIKQENLLFKIRMAEAALDTTRPVESSRIKERL
jgi:hypothetical protein